MAGLLSTNVTGNLATTSTANMLAEVIASGSPLSNVLTQGMTGITAYQVANSQTGTTAANTLAVTFNEPGMYSIGAFLILGTVGNPGTANVSNVGCNVKIMSSVGGTFTGFWYATGNIGNGTHTIRTTLQTSFATKIVESNIALATAESDYLVYKGVVNVGGSLPLVANVQFNASNTVNGNVMIMANSYISFLKIG